jgi:hypothetical protein
MHYFPTFKNYFRQTSHKFNHYANSFNLERVTIQIGHITCIVVNNGQNFLQNYIVKIVALI